VARIILVVVAVLLSPIIVVVWALAREARRSRGLPAGWLLAAGIAGLALVVWRAGGLGPALADHYRWLAEVPLQQLGGGRPHVQIGGALWPQLALAVPAGLLAAGLARRRPLAVPGPDSVRTQARTARTARRVAGRPAVVESLALGRSLGGDLPAPWRAGQFVVLPDSAARLSRLYVGRPGAGKTTGLAREVFLAAYAGRQVVALDGKGDRATVETLVDAYVAGWQLRHGRDSFPTVHLFPDEPLNGWQGEPADLVNRLLACWVWTPEADIYRQRSTLALRLACAQPGPPVRSMRELVERLDPAVLAKVWRDHPTEGALARDLKAHLADVSVRVSNLAAAIGGQLDGDRAIGDADLTVVSVPTMAAQEDAESLFRVLMADVAHWVAVRKGDRAALLVVDEFSAIDGGRGHAIHIVERGRSAGVPAILAAQSYAGLGDEQERDRIVSGTAWRVLFASDMPDELARLAGTVQTMEAVLQAEDGRWTGRSSVSTRARHRLDPNTVRELQPGQAVIVAGGRAERMQVIRAPGADNGLALPRRPFAVAGRVPRRLRPRQDLASRPASRASDLDPPGSGGVRRYRSGPVAQEQPPNDRAEVQ
jgi:hypothetical protein